MNTRDQMQELIRKTKTLLIEEREIAIKSVFLIGEIHSRNIPANYGCSHEEFAEKVLEISA